MALINRISRLIRADVHAVLDYIEEPEQLLRQAIRDMEEELAATGRRVKLCTQDQEALAGRIREIESSLTENDDQLDLCFESGKDQLAKQLIRKKLEAQRLLKRLRATHREADCFLDQQRKYLDENQATLERLRQKAELFVRPSSAQDGPFESDGSGWSARGLSVGDAEVEIAFLQEMSRRNAP